MTTTITGNGIPLYRLLAVRGMVRLEARGMKFRGGSVTARMKRELGVKGNRDAVLQAIEAAIAAQAAELRPGDIVSDIRVRSEVYATAVRELENERCPHCDVANASEYIRCIACGRRPVEI